MKDVCALKVKDVLTNIKLVRIYRNYTQEYVAMMLSISQNAYSKVEMGSSSITLCRLIEIGIILEVQVAWLIDTKNDASEKLRDLPKVSKIRP